MAFQETLFKLNVGVDTYGPDIAESGSLKFVRLKNVKPERDRLVCPEGFSLLQTISPSVISDLSFVLKGSYFFPTISDVPLTSGGSADITTTIFGEGTYQPFFVIEVTNPNSVPATMGTIDVDMVMTPDNPDVNYELGVPATYTNPPYINTADVLAAGDTRQLPFVGVGTASDSTSGVLSLTFRWSDTSGSHSFSFTINFTFI